MNTRTQWLLAACIAGCAGIVGANGAQGRITAPSLLLFNQGNSIVGHWQGHATVGPCAGGVPTTFITMGAFHAGGTLGYSSTAIPASASGPTFGSWGSFVDRSTRSIKFQAHMQFFRYTPAGAYDGIQDIHRTLTLSKNARSMTETVVANVLNADGSLRVRLCGTGTDERIDTD